MKDKSILAALVFSAVIGGVHAMDHRRVDDWGNPVDFGVEDGALRVGLGLAPVAVAPAHVRPSYLAAVRDGAQASPKSPTPDFSQQLKTKTLQELGAYARRLQRQLEGRLSATDKAAIKEDLKKTLVEITRLEGLVAAEEGKD
jgi:hypothetical protein